jgi:hypothetical protein
MRRFLALASVVFSLSLATGCDSGIKPGGAPAKIDMSKDYTPKATLPTMTPGDQAKAEAKLKAQGNTAPAGKTEP